jgi:hypothetical protein
MLEAVWPLRRKSAAVISATSDCVTGPAPGRADNVRSVNSGPANVSYRSKITLVYGESFTQEVTPGQHHLRVHNTLFWKNVRFAIEPGGHLEFVIINGAKWWTYGIVGLLGSAPRLSLR